MKRYLFVYLFSLFTIFGLFAQEPGTGLVFDLESYRGTPYKMQLTAGSYQSMPSQASLEQYCPNPGNQGPYSTCVAFAAGYHLRTILQAKSLGLTDKSQIDRLTFSASFVYESIKSADDTDCLSGANPIHALELLRNMGVPSTQAVPYACGQTISSGSMLEALDFTIKDYQILFLPDAEAQFRINSTKKALAEGYPVLLCFVVPESFYTSGPTWRPNANDTGPTGQHGRHAMCIVGYDDRHEGGAFRVMNSWGTNWADKGYVWIRYEDFAKWSLGAMQAYPHQPEPKPEPTPQPTPKPTPTPTPKPTPIPVPLPVPNNLALEGIVHFQTRDGRPMLPTQTSSRNLVVEADTYSDESLVAYTMQDAYPSGTRFRFFITTNTESYIYAFATDLTQEVNKILPYEDNMSPLIGPNSTVAFPSESKVIRMDNQPGTDYLLILYSRERLDIDAMMQTMAQTNGGLTEKIQAALGDRLIDEAYIQYQSENMGFQVEGNPNGDVVPLMVEIQHR